MGAVYTPGQYQTLLNQSLIPCTMLASAAFLRSRYKASQYIGAAIILGGAAFVVSPELFGAHGKAPIESHYSSNLLYFISNIPMALSAVYKVPWCSAVALLCWLQLEVALEHAPRCISARVCVQWK